jgi:transposase
MTKYSTEEKVEAVLAYLEGKESYKTIAEERKMRMAPLKRWVLRYREHGGEVSSLQITIFNLKWMYSII